MNPHWLNRLSYSAIFIASLSLSYANADELPISISQGATVAAQNEVASRTQLVNKTAKKIADVRAALMAYYSDKLAWPAALNDLASSGYYPSADWSTPYGNITGAISANNYILSLTLPDGSRAAPIGKLIAAKADGTASGTNNTNLKFSLGTPSQATLVKNMLSRKADPANPTANMMETAINMSGNNILNIGNADVQILNGGTATFTGKTITNQFEADGTSVFNGATTVNNTLVVTGKTTLADLSANNVLVNGSHTVNGASVLNGATTINNSLNVTGKSTLADLSANNVLVNGTHTVTGASVLNGATTVKNTLNVTGKTTLADLSANNVQVNGTHTVTGTSTLNGATTINNTLNVSGVTNLSDTNINNLLVKANQTVLGATILNGSLSAGQTTLSNLTVNGVTHLNSDLFGGNATFTGNLTTGNITANTVHANTLGYVDGGVAKDVATEINALKTTNEQQDSRLSNIENWEPWVNNNINSLTGRVGNIENWEGGVNGTLANHEARISNLEGHIASQPTAGGVSSVAYPYNGYYALGTSFSFSKPALVTIKSSYVSTYTYYSSQYSSQTSTSGISSFNLSGYCPAEELSGSYTISTAATTNSKSDTNVMYATCMVPAGTFTLNGTKEGNGTMTGPNSIYATRVTAIYLN